MRTVLYTLLAMIAFAGNSLLCRLALKHTGIDALTFTTIRLLSGAFILWLIVILRRGQRHTVGNWISAVALLIYAFSFSYAYIHLSAATGTLLLFGAVQITMIGYGVGTGERLGTTRTIGLLSAFGGLLYLMLPGLAAPSLSGALLMLAAGIAWGVYSLRGKHSIDAIGMTADNFVRAAAVAVLLSLVVASGHTGDRAGIWYAIYSGAITSGIGYAIWYIALRKLSATNAASVQLSVPVMVGIGGIVWLGEPMTTRLILASIAILGGVFLTVKR